MLALRRVQRSKFGLVNTCADSVSGGEGDDLLVLPSDQGSSVLSQPSPGVLRLVGSTTAVDTRFDDTVEQIDFGLESYGFAFRLAPLAVAATDGDDKLPGRTLADRIGTLDGGTRRAEAASASVATDCTTNGPNAEPQSSGGRALGHRTSNGCLMAVPPMLPASGLRVPAGEHPRGEPDAPGDKAAYPILGKGDAEAASTG
jgi:hypothetical protein